MYASGVIRMGGVFMQVLMQRGNYRLASRYIKFSHIDLWKSKFDFYFIYLN